MSDISSINQVLAEMRRLSAAAAGSPLEQGDKTQGAGTDFSALLKQSIDQVNETQKAAGKLSDAFSAGDPNIDVAEVMVALQKAGVAFQAMTEVRNKLVSVPARAGMFSSSQFPATFIMLPSGGPSVLVSSFPSCPANS